MVKKLLHTRSGRGSQLVFLKAPHSDEEIEICKFDESGPIVVGPDLTHLAFEVDDLEKFAKHAEAKGCPLSDGPHSTGSGKIAFIDAPEGYEIELIERARES
jgi:lactoylglutathione lyase